VEAAESPDTLHTTRELWEGKGELLARQGRDWVLELELDDDGSAVDIVALLPRYKADGQLDRLGGVGKYVIVHVRRMQFREGRRWVSACSDAEHTTTALPDEEQDPCCQRSDDFLGHRPDDTVAAVFGSEELLCRHGAAALAGLEEAAKRGSRELRSLQDGARLRRGQGAAGRYTTITATIPWGRLAA